MLSVMNRASSVADPWEGSRRPVTLLFWLKVKKSQKKKKKGRESSPPASPLAQGLVRNANLCGISVK